MITVFTPCYNRGYTLERLFESLQAQTYRDFEWIIIDDGSTDNTKEICYEFINKSTFTIKYRYQDNLGKHVAINNASELAKGEWFFIVDSDDWLPANSLEENMRYIMSIESDRSFVGVSGVCVHTNGSIACEPYRRIDDCPRKVQARFNLDYIDATPQEYREKYKMPGDRAEVVRTEVVKRYHFPYFKGERFISEFFIWQSISNEGLKIRWFNKPTYYCEYLEDGLSKNIKTTMKQNPLGRSYVDNFTTASHVRFRTKFKSAINYIRYGRYAGISTKELLGKANNPLLVLAGLPAAFLFPIRKRSEPR